MSVSDRRWFVYSRVPFFTIHNDTISEFVKMGLGIGLRSRIRHFFFVLNFFQTSCTTLPHLLSLITTRSTNNTRETTRTPPHRTCAPCSFYSPKCCHHPELSSSPFLTSQKKTKTRKTRLCLTKKLLCYTVIP